MIKTEETKQEGGLPGRLSEIEDRKGKAIFVVVMVVFLVTVWKLLDLVLMTFILSFVFYYLDANIQRQCKKFFNFTLPNWLVLVLSYILFIGILAILIAEGLPGLMRQCTGLIHILMTFDFANVVSSMNPRIAAILSYVDFNTHISNISAYVAQFAVYLTAFGFDFFVSMILSFTILAERKKLARFGTNLSNSKVGFIYDYFEMYGAVFVQTFAKVMKVQVTIAFINCILSMILLKAFGFPGIAGLGVMIFFLGLVPVAGVVISLIPLSVVAFTVGGMKGIIEIVIMILVLHAIEAYVLNPRLMANQTKLPVCLVFIILLIAQNHLGVWGLLIGVPIFIFLMIALEVDYKVEGEKIIKNKIVRDKTVIKNKGPFKRRPPNEGPQKEMEKVE